MTPEQKRNYLTSPDNCPFCGSGDITGRCFSYEDPSAQIIDCEGCGKSWMDIYTLTDVEEVENDEV